MLRPFTITWLAPAALICITMPAAAATFLSVEQAQDLYFPSQRMLPMPVTLLPAQIKQLEKYSGTKVREISPKIWRSSSGGWFYIDRVIGKHEFITYALALTPDGAVAGVEILDYRETYGGEVKNPQWRAQFKGKRNGATLKLDSDIVNLSGATLSCRNLTLGVKRLLATHQLLFSTN